MTARTLAFTLVVVLLFSGSLAAQPQPTAKVYRIGYVTLAGALPATQDPFREGLRDAGWIEGQHVIVEARSAGGREDLLPGLVADVIRRNIDVLVVTSTQTALAAKHATSTIPVVFASVFDPVGAGIVTNLARPGGNITGSAMGVGGGFGGKWLELLKEAVPGITHVAALWSSKNQSSRLAAQEIQAAAGAMNVKLDMLDAGNAARLEKAFARITASRPQGIVVAPDPYFNTNRGKLVQFAASRRLPAVYFFRSFAEAGGLMAYGANHADSHRAAAQYVDKILKGAKPGDLPVEQPARFELVINAKAAAALGLTIPPALLLRADRVIQ